MRILINGLGCPYTGSKYILEQIVSSAPANLQLTVIVPIVNNSTRFDFPRHVNTIRLKHGIWGMYLRVFLELYANVLMVFRRYDLLVNVSNYGLCFTKRQVLYIHNPYILDMSAPTRLGQGNPNRPIRLALNTYLRNGESIFLQTDHMLHQLKEYCIINSLPFPKSVNVLKPPFPSPTGKSGVQPPKTFGFQLFYPASPFPHKRTDLAVKATTLARNSDNRIGLHLTIDSATPVEGIHFLGLISRSEVYDQFRISDAMLFTSERETLGLPLLEAMYFDKPAILPNKEYAKEIYGDAGVYYDDFTPDAICNAIVFLFHHYDDYTGRVTEQKQKQMRTRLPWAEHWNVFIDSIPKLTTHSS